ncbi:MAG: alpha-L-fucosidase [Clostridia bacterium]
MKQSELAKPTEAQKRWQDLEMGMFCHFGLNTFCNREWGEGEDSPTLFNPQQLNAYEWIKTAKEAGFKYFILTAKHHDGFCLWQTDTTSYSVKSSPWKEGKGDVVAECAKACRELGMHFGVYLSPWDRHEPCYSDKEAYDEFYVKQLTELVTGYGELFELWFDGAGSNGREYDWRRIIGIVNKYQPDAMIFNMGIPTIRWVGNEEGTAPYPCWNTVKEAKKTMVTNDMLTWLPETRDWVPAECDVPIRKLHWFWHPEDEASLLSLDELKNIYYHSVGHGANLLLNVAPDNRGLLPECDTLRVKEFGEWIEKTFSNTLGETQGRGEELEIYLEESTEISHIVLMEDISEGELVKEYIVESEDDGSWVELAHGTAVGHKKIDRISPMYIKRIRLRILKAEGNPNIAFSIY